MQKTQKFEQILQKDIFNKEDFDYNTLLSTQIPPSIDELTSENCILFALGIGYSKDPIAEKEDLKYTYELHDNFSIFPMHGFNLLKDKNPFEYLLYAKGKPIPHPMCLVHGEERCEIYKQFYTEQKYYTETKIIDAEDKISGLLMTHCSSTFEYNNGKKGDLVFKSINSWFLRGLGGSKFKGTGQRIKMPQIPKKNPIFETIFQTDKNQHSLYRLAGDKNPLHIDNKEAQKGGFKMPILHGMCFYSIGIKNVLKHFCNGDHNLLNVTQCRFIGHVYPGETIKYSFWKESGQVILLGQVLERKTNCIFGFVELKSFPNL